MKAICTFVLVACLYASGAGQCPVTMISTDSVLESCDVTVSSGLFYFHPFYNSLYDNYPDLPEGPILMEVKFLDSCNSVTIAYELDLDLNGDSIPESRISSNNPLPPGHLVFGNIGPQPDSLVLFDNRPYSSDSLYQFNLEQTILNDTVCYALKWNSNNHPTLYFWPELPHGRHYLRWMIEFQGQIDTLEQEIVIKDCNPPTIVCENSLLLNLPPSNFVNIFVLDALIYSEDDFTLTNLIEFSIEKAENSSGIFPLDTSGNPVDMIVYDCDDLGTHEIQLWARDVAGNSQFCEITVLVNDNGGFCGPANSDIAVCAFTECGDPIRDAWVEINGLHPAFPPVNYFFDLTNSSGCLSTQLQALPIAGNYTLGIYKDNNHLNGVTTFDLVLISKHILGLEVLPSPYKMIAADANKSNSLTTFDIVEFRKLILGIYDELPNNTSWRFVDESFTFTNPQNPFLDDFPESIDSLWMFTDSILFVGVKVGDVNCSADGLGFLSMDDRQSLPLIIPNRRFEKGELIEIPIYISSNSLQEGAQLALNWDTDLLSFQELSPGKLSNLNQECFALPYPGELRMSWVAGRPESISEDKPLFILRFHALKDGELNGSIELNDNALRAEAYPADQAPVNLQLFFQKEIDGGISVYSPYPNPGNAKTNWLIQTEFPSRYTLQLYDHTGREVFRQSAELVTGNNPITTPAEAFPQSGLFFWKINIENREFSGKLLRH